MAKICRSGTGTGSVIDELAFNDSGGGRCCARGVERAVRC